MLSCFQSALYVKEVQSDKGLSGALVELEVGVDGHRAQNIRIETKGQNDDSVVLDMPEGLLVGYQVFGPQEHGDNNYKYEKDVSVTPFKRTVKLLKTVTFILIGKISLTFSNACVLLSSRLMSIFIYACQNTSTMKTALKKTQ